MDVAVGYADLMNLHTWAPGERRDSWRELTHLGSSRRSGLR
jgi:hypothetical protein